MAEMAPPMALTLKADLAALARIRSWVEEVAKSAKASKDLETYLLAAIDEAAANIVEHGYHGIPAGPLKLEASWDSNQIHVRIEDEGLPFDPSRGGDSLDLDWRARWNLGRGLGRYVIRRCVHQIKYERLPLGANRLSLTFRMDCDKTGAHSHGDTMEKNGEKP